MYLYWLYEIPLWINMVLFLLVLVIPMEIGFRVGLRAHRANPEAEHAARSDITAASMLTLLGLMLAFTYAFSMSRADLRKQELMAEVNAISTAYLRADLAREPGRTELRTRLLEYARSRVVAPEMVRNRQQFQNVVAHSLRMQARIWPATKSVVLHDDDMPAPLKVSLVQAVNDVLDAHTRRMAVIYDRLPGAVMILLWLIGAAAMGMAAYSAGLTGNTCRWRMYVFAFILAALMLLILDFDIIVRGLVRVSHQSLVSLVQEMEAGIGP